MPYLMRPAFFDGGVQKAMLAIEPGKRFLCIPAFELADDYFRHRRHPHGATVEVLLMGLLTAEERDARWVALGKLCDHCPDVVDIIAAVSRWHAIPIRQWPFGVKVSVVATAGKNVASSGLCIQPTDWNGCLARFHKLFGETNWITADRLRVEHGNELDRRHRILMDWQGIIRFPETV